MAVLMGSAMAIVMLGFMWGRMYRNTVLNVVIMVAALVVGGTSYALSQTQTLVGDEAYMRAMTPHRSIAILTSEQANPEDARVRELADGISKTQAEEIREMDWLLDDIAENGKAATAQEAAQRPVPDFSEEADRWLGQPRWLLWAQPAARIGWGR